MPDPTLQTISGTQSAMLFNLSPYGTRFMLWEHIAKGFEMPPPDDHERLEWGKRLQDDILDATAHRLALTVTENAEDEYQRHGSLPVGATIDAIIECPTRGRGIVQAKAVDYLVWRDNWTEEAAPAHIEIQTQHEMLVVGATWGVISCLVGGNALRLYKREVNAPLQQAIAREASGFFESVALSSPPDALGDPMEIGAMHFVHPDLIPEPPLIITDRKAALVLEEYENAQFLSKFWEKDAENLKAKLLAMAEGHANIRTPGKAAYINRIKMAGSSVGLPENIRQAIEKVLKIDACGGVPSIMLNDEDRYALNHALEWRHETRKPGVQNRIKIGECSSVEAEPQQEKVKTWLA